MNRWFPTAIAFSLLLSVGCTSREDTPAPGAPVTAVADAEADAAPAAPAYVNKVWRVSESQQVSPGDLRIFLSDGTLVMASDRAKPALGRWREVEGKLTITEEGIDYPTDVLESTADTLRIRMLSPGDPVELQLRLVTGAAAASPTALALTGTVRHLDLEGGHYIIETADGTRYQPIDLPAAFRREGMRVEVQAVKRDDMMSIGMTGALIELRQIREQK